ncbi:MAG: glycosyl hydrolase family 3 [Anaerolineae bacterium]|nr:glycosyl hydrolase family 3 [Anaerolineae bacterium]
MELDNLLQQMTLAEKVGQLFLLAFSKDRLDEARTLFREYFVGASYISNDNVPSPTAAAALTTQLQGFAAETRLQIPLLLGVDQEGAWGVMMAGSCTGPGNMALGATGNPDDAYRMYEIIGRELSTAGLNTLLAPCADCNSNPHNAIIGMRSFGEPASLVAAMTEGAVRGAHAGGALTSVKHFPGHGDTTTDSHRGIPTVTRSRAQLDQIDLLPFRRGIAAGADIVMTAHIIFTALDPDNPATLSPAILRDLLRHEMGFDGVILSDSMNMRAMKAHYAPEDSAVRALNAGVDLLMLAEEHYDHDAATYLRNQIALIEAVQAAVENGALPISRVDDAVRRVLRLKLATLSFPAGSEDQPQPAAIGTEQHRASEREIARHAVSLVRGAADALPISTERKVVVVNTTRRGAYAILDATRGIGPNQAIPAFDHFVAEMERVYPHLRVIDAAESIDLDNAAAGIADDETVIAVTENYPMPGMDFDKTGQAEIANALGRALGPRLIVVALRDPYELSALPDVQTYVCAFSFRMCAAQAAVDVLSGAVAAQGQSPVSVPGTDVAAHDLGEG